ncbi:MAG: FAD-binding oxidoreductase [Chloroflexi bacterium]|nr:FAD-binding oxidoreductase [Chloroflexota bacterium]
MSHTTADIIICGAGIAGISAAYQLAAKKGVKNILLVDERAPLSLTSDKSTECYRNWWPGPGDAMVALMNRSIDILEDLARESDNVFHMNRRGYLYASADPKRIAEMRRAGEEAATLGAGPLRCHTRDDSTYVPSAAHGFESELTGSDLILDPALIRRYFPYLAENTLAVLHARRCGWLSAQTLGMYMLERARDCGVRFRSARVVGVDARNDRIETIRLSDGTTISTGTFIIAAGPLSKQVAALIGVDLPVLTELHLNVGLRDDLGVFPRDAPLLIWTDPQFIAWSEEERTAFAESEETRFLLNEFPSGVHARSEGNYFLGLWTYDTTPVEPVYPPTFDPHHPEIVLRGLTTMLPPLKVYRDKPPRPVLNGGYYCKTRENRPLIGPLPMRGAYVIDALSGFGIMAACAAGELLAAHIVGQVGNLSYAPAFMLERYQDPEYQKLLENWGASGQL